MGWLYLILAAVVLSLGAVRVAQEPQAPEDADALASALADCLPPITIAEGSRLKVMALPFSNGNVTADHAMPPPSWSLNVKQPITLASDAWNEGTGELTLGPATHKSFELVRHGIGLGDQVVAKVRTQRTPPVQLPANVYVRLNPAPEFEYRFQVPKDRITAGRNKTVILKSGEGSTLMPGEGVDAVTAHPLTLRWRPTDLAASLRPAVLAGQSGLSTVAVDLYRPGLRFDADTVLHACVSTHPSGQWMAAGVSKVESGLPGQARAWIALPSLEPQQRDESDARPPFLTNTWVAIATADGQYVALGSFNTVKRWQAGLLALGFTALLLVPLMVRRGSLLNLRVGNTSLPKPWLSSLFRGADNDPSLSLLQMFIWTVVTVWGLLYVFIVAGELLKVTAEVLGLLGLAGAGTVIARGIATSRGGSTSQAAPGETADSNSSAFWSMLATHGRFDLLKLQFFLFTVLIATYVLWRIGNDAAFPALGMEALLLMGVSEGVYLAGKFASTNAWAQAQAAHAALAAARTRLDDLRSRNGNQSLDKEVAAAEAEIAKLTAELDKLLAGLKT